VEEVGGPRSCRQQESSVALACIIVHSCASLCRDDDVSNRISDFTTSEFESLPSCRQEHPAAFAFITSHHRRHFPLRRLSTPSTRTPTLDKSQRLVATSNHQHQAIMDDELIANFTAFTEATPERARQYLTLTENNLEQAVQLYFDNGGIDMGATFPQQPAQPAQPASRRYNEDNNGVVTIDSDDDEPAYEDDEAMARRLQQEAYGTAGGEEEVRAPMARTTETLVGPGSTWVGDDGDDVDAAVQEQMMARQRRGRSSHLRQPASLLTCC